MPAINTPLDVVDPIAVYTASEDEVGIIDVLVCGVCLKVFHFIEDFREHKDKNTCRVSDRTITNPSHSDKPQIWAFLIWKNSQNFNTIEKSWSLYQKWCNMPVNQKASWITAGRDLQTFFNLSQSSDSKKMDSKNADVDPDLDDDLEEDFVVESIAGKRYNHNRNLVEYLVKWEGYPKEQNTWEPLSNLTTCKSLLQEYERKLGLNDNSIRLPGVLRKDIVTPNNTKPTQMKFGFADKKIETNRKIVPVSPGGSQKNFKVSPIKIDSVKSVAPNQKLNNTLETNSNANKLIKPIISPTSIRSTQSSDDNPVLITASPEPQSDNDVGSVPSASNDWCDLEDKNRLLPIKSMSGSKDESPSSKRPKLIDTERKEDVNGDSEKETQLSSPAEDDNPLLFTDKIPQPSRSGIFRKSDLRGKLTSNASGDAYERTLREFAEKAGVSKNGECLRGVLQLDRSNFPEIVPGVYRMSVKAGISRLHSVNGGVNDYINLPTMPGPKGGVVFLSKKFDASRIVHPVVNTFSNLTPNSPTIDRLSHATGLTDSPSHKETSSRLLSVTDSVKKNNTMFKKFLAPVKKGRTSSITLTNISKNTKSSTKDPLSENSSRMSIGDGDNTVIDFNDMENSDLEDYSFPDDFPDELNMAPLTPNGPFTLDPENGKRLMRAEGEPTPQPTPEPSPVPSPVPPQIVCKEEHSEMNDENMIVKTTQSADGDTYAEINGNTYKVTSSEEVDLLQNTVFTQANGNLEGIQVPSDSISEANGMITITGEDGLVYQVANAKMEGGTIVLAGDGDEQQQCVFVTEDGHQVMQRTGEDGQPMLTLEGAYTDAVAQLVPNQVNILPDGSQIYVKQEENGQVELVQLQGATSTTEGENVEQEQQQITDNADDSANQQVVAQLVDPGVPNPDGGPRRVVLLLPDGNLVVTEVDEEQFAAFELEKQ